MILQVRKEIYVVRNSRNCNFVSTDKPMLADKEHKHE